MPRKKKRSEPSVEIMRKMTIADLFEMSSELSERDAVTLMNAWYEAQPADKRRLLEMPEGLNEAREILQLVDPFETPELAAKAAQKAIAVCPQCMEAYVQLAELEKNTSKILEYASQAIQQGNWMIALEGSPFQSQYQVLLEQLSDQLWAFGQRAESLEYLNKVFELNESLSTFMPRLNNPVEVKLALRLIDMGWDDELAKPLEAIDRQENTIEGLLLHLLLAYRAEGDSAATRELALQLATSSPGLLQHLLGDKALPGDLAELDDDSEEQHAAWLSSLAMPTLRTIPGMTRWLREILPHKAPSDNWTDQDRDDELEILAQLDQSDSVWLVDVRRMFETWVAAAMTTEEDADDYELLGIEAFQKKPTPMELWDWLTSLMMSNNEGGSRPKKIGVILASWIPRWKKRCKLLNIELFRAEKNSVPKELFEDIEKAIERVEVKIEIDEEFLNRIRQYPRGEESWIMGIFQPPLWIHEQATPRRPWVILVVDPENGLILMQDMQEEPPEDWLFHTFLKAVDKPLVQVESYIPSEILVDGDADSGDFAEQLRGLDVACRTASEEESEILRECVASLIKHCSGPVSPPALRDIEGIEENELTSLYQSLARFWRAALWRTIPGDHPIELQCDLFEGGKRWAIVVGQLGMHFGMVIYDDWTAVQDMLNSTDDKVEPDGLFINFVEAFDIPSIDYWYMEQNQWAVANEEAYPMIERVMKGNGHRRPTSDELFVLEMVAKVLPAFVNHPQSAGEFSLPVQVWNERSVVRAKWCR